MSDIIVRNVEKHIIARLKRRAVRHNRTMDEEIRHILRASVKHPDQQVDKLGSRIAARFAKIGLTEEESLELPGVALRFPD